MDELSKELTVEMFEDGLWREIAKAIGAENVYKLAKVTGGVTVYIPRAESVVRPIRDARIKAEFNGFNHIELAEKYNVTERWVRALCGLGITEGQIGLFDDLDNDSRN